MVDGQVRKCSSTIENIAGSNPAIRSYTWHSAWTFQHDIQLEDGHLFTMLPDINGVFKRAQDDGFQRWRFKTVAEVKEAIKSIANSGQ